MQIVFFREKLFENAIHWFFFVQNAKNENTLINICYNYVVNRNNFLLNVTVQPQHMWKPPGRNSRSCYQFSLHTTSLSRQVAVCTALVCRAQCSMPVTLGHWQNQTSNICSGMTGQWSNRSAMSGPKTLSPPGPMNYLHSLALRIWTLFWRREGSAGMDMWNTPMVQSRQPFTYRLRESMGLGGPRWHGSSWQRGIAESGSSQLSTLMIEVCGNLVWDLRAVSSYLEGGPLLWMLPLYLHVNKKSEYDDDDDDDATCPWLTNE